MLDANFRASTAAIHVYIQALVLQDLIRRLIFEIVCFHTHTFHRVR